MEILNDFSTSVKKALEEIDPNYESYDGLVICGTHAPHDVEEMIGKIKEARISGRPYLGICAGHQYAAIEYARNVCGMEDATSEEFGQGTYIVKRLPQLKVGGYQDKEGSRWNNYEVDMAFSELLWIGPDHFITTQAHPEYESSIDKPHPLLLKFIKLCKNKTK